MISDVLHDATAEINRYLLEMPSAYKDPSVRQAVDEVLSAMHRLVVILDTPPCMVNVKPLFGSRRPDRPSD